MASTDATPIPIKNQAYRATFPILDADGDLVTGATALDSEVSKDGGTFADATSEATEIATSSGVYYLDFSATEMNADTVAVIVKTTTTGAKTTVIVLYPQQSGDIPVQVEGMDTGVLTAAALAADAVDEIIDEVVEGTITMRQAFRAVIALAAAKSTGGGTTTPAFRDQADTKDRISYTVDANGNRTAVVIDLT